MNANATRWSNALDAEMRDRYDGHPGELVRGAYTLGHAGGVTIDLEADDDYGRQLTSADGQMVARYDPQQHWWVAV